MRKERRILVAHPAIAHHTYGCHTAACDKRVGRAWWRRHHRKVQPAGLSSAEASWYEDAGSTACGTHYTLGIANKTLPCGTRVRICYGKRCVLTVVDDRGPYVGARLFDLNQTAASALGFDGVAQVRYRIE